LAEVKIKVETKGDFVGEGRKGRWGWGLIFGCQIPVMLDRFFATFWLKCRADMVSLNENVNIKAVTYIYL